MRPSSSQNPSMEAGSIGGAQGRAGVSNNVVATCIAKISSRYYLLIENEVNLTGAAIRPVVAIRLNDDQARKLLEAGIQHCNITDSVPNSSPGLTADFKGILPIESQSFLVFDTTMGLSDQKHHIVLVNAPLCPVIDETS